MSTPTKDSSRRDSFDSVKTSNVSSPKVNKNTALLISQADFIVGLLHSFCPELIGLLNRNFGLVPSKTRTPRPIRLQCDNPIYDFGLLTFTKYNVNFVQKVDFCYISVEKPFQSEDSEFSPAMSEGVFEMPYNLVKEDIEKSFKSKWKALRKLHKQRVKPEELAKKTESTGKRMTFTSESIYYSTSFNLKAIRARHKSKF